MNRDTRILLSTSLMAVFTLLAGILWDMNYEGSSRSFGFLAVASLVFVLCNYGSNDDEEPE